MHITKIYKLWGRRKKALPMKAPNVTSKETREKHNQLLKKIPCISTKSLLKTRNILGTENRICRKEISENFRAT